MSVSVKIVGKICNIEDEQIISDKFKKRGFLLESYDNYSGYVDRIYLELIQDKCGLIEEGNFLTGDSVVVFANIRCREWNGKYFISLQAYKITKADEDHLSKDKVVENSNEKVDNVNNSQPVVEEDSFSSPF